MASRRGVDPFAEVKERVHSRWSSRSGPRLYDPHLSESELAAQVRATLQQVIDSEQTPLSHADRTKIAQDVSDDILGHGPLEPYLRDADVTEIMVNGPDDIFIERDGRIFPVDAQFSDDAHLRRTIDKIVVAGGPPRRRVEPHGRRPTTRRLARQCGRCPDRPRRRAADHPQVRCRSLHRPRSHLASGR